jgi:hypothetical protein
MLRGVAFSFAAIDPATHRRSLLVEVHSENHSLPEPALLDGLANRMFQRGIPLGMLVTRLSMYVVRWSFGAQGWVRWNSPPLPTTGML